MAELLLIEHRRRVGVRPDGSITHGQQLSPTSAGAALQIGPTGPLEARLGGTLSGTQVLENVQFNGNITIAAGANITLRNFRVVGSFQSTSYAIRHTAGGESILDMEDGEVIGRAAGNDASLSVRCLAMFSNGNVKANKVIFRGGIDNIYLRPPTNSPGAFSTGDSVCPSARGWFIECWFGDIERVASSHSDCFQIDGGGHVLIERSRIMSYSLPVGSDPLSVRVTDPSAANLASGGLILTQNSSNLSVIQRVAFRDSWVEGGNYSVDMNPPELPTENSAVTDCLFGVRSNFGPLRRGVGTISVNNLWGQTGDSPVGPVVEGQPV